ncbi:MFS transporter [Paraburkholderia phenoliruptrix]|uniref:MFS transporter, SHS family, lactate transporter n=2 Tax=Paraburkholderia phenoliruptrix TaxID=252970 RepID=K0DPX5_9BURK|nr:MFS transporter [Paraburkholderia phenoliruptrix]AFT85514.1 MFS transporter, SHS family, lactate transporter [Paraburkholderia phenoliruptrix BR3459a]MDR6421613.1 SHS family lactate transporter-like MFS transporter [Paraburkholderia phenoliruptrix]CAB4048030.1 Putative metabolite transport protein YjhB [Paraburkholderia phenoliruptrix]
MSWTREQRNVTIAAYLGWTLDAFDFFLMVFVLKDIAAEFNTKIPEVAFGIMLTLMMRPLGALIFGWLADRYGRRPTLMVNIACFSLLELLSGFSPNLAILLVLRALFGIAMGGEWGVGGALTMETVPPKSRGIVSGLLQAGYPSGYLLASVVFGVFYQYIGWRGMFFVGVLPALLVLYIRAHVPESPAFKTLEKQARPGLVATLKQNVKLSLYAIVLMTAFNFFSHGSQDLYPTFLRVQHHFDAHTVSLITITLNIGAICGGLFFGMLSEKTGRKRAIFISALIALPVLPLWAFSSTPVLLAVGAFLMQISVQGAWGVIPVHLNEISPDEIRATFPGLVYQLGNLIASVNGPLQASAAEAHGNNYALVMAVVIGIVALVICALIPFSRERRGIDMTQSAAHVGEPVQGRPAGQQL